MKFHLLKAKRGKRGHNLLQREEKGFLPETEYAEAAASREEATLMVSRNDEVEGPQAFGSSALSTPSSCKWSMMDDKSSFDRSNSSSYEPGTCSFFASE